MIKLIAAFATYFLSVVLVVVFVAIIVIESQHAVSPMKPLLKNKYLKTVACDDLAVCQFQDHTGSEIFPPIGSLQ